MLQDVCMSCSNTWTQSRHGVIIEQLCFWQVKLHNNTGFACVCDELAFFLAMQMTGWGHCWRKTSNFYFQKSVLFCCLSTPVTLSWLALLNAVVGEYLLTKVRWGKATRMHPREWQEASSHRGGRFEFWQKAFLRTFTWNPESPWSGKRSHSCCSAHSLFQHGWHDQSTTCEDSRHQIILRLARQI